MIPGNLGQPHVYNQCPEQCSHFGIYLSAGGREEYGKLARKYCWNVPSDPKGATGYRYNEAGMPYNYYFSRTYTFINDLISEAEKEKCREVMTIRGREMYDHLYPRHFWRPYSSHSNRSAFSGEIGIAFLDEIPEAQEWVWFAANVFTNVYPVWSDQYGGCMRGYPTEQLSQPLHLVADIMRWRWESTLIRNHFFQSRFLSHVSAASRNPGGGLAI